MEKRKAWHFYLILGVVFLTVYNILPTIFFYSQPLKQPIGPKEASKVAQQIITRVNSLEDFTFSWLKAQSKNLGLKPLSINLDKENPRLAHVEFKSEEEAKKFSKSLERAGALIPFVPAQLSPAPRSPGESTTVSVQRKIGVHLDPAQSDKLFYYVPKVDESGAITSEYRRLVYQRALELAESFVAKSSEAQLVDQIQNIPDYMKNEGLLRLSRNLVDFNEVFIDHPEALARYFASIHLTKEKASSVVGGMEEIKTQMQKQFSNLETQEKELKSKGQILDSSLQQKATMIKSQLATLNGALKVLKRESANLPSNASTFDSKERLASLLKEKVNVDTPQLIELGNKHPFIQSIGVDLGREQLTLNLHNDVNAIRQLEVSKESDALKQEKLGQILINEIAAAARSSEEKISPALTNFSLSLTL
jgi:SecD/SecF fusion protein